MKHVQILFVAIMLLSGCSGGATAGEEPEPAAQFADGGKADAGGGTTGDAASATTSTPASVITEEQASPFLGSWSGTIDGKGTIAFAFLFMKDKLVAQTCERVGKDCNDLEEISIKGSTLTGTIAFQEDVVGADGLPTGQKKTEHVTYSLTLSQNGKSLAGPYTSTKCGCSGAVTASKL